MPWEEKTVKEQRQSFVEAAKQSTNFSALCREFGITRKTGYKWLERAASGESLEDKSHARKDIGNKTDSSIEQLILSMRDKNPGWGAKTIHKVLLNAGHDDLPCVKTVNNILKRNGCISEEESLKRVPYIRFQKEFCNDMWQTDFKGEFKLLDNSYCYPLTILDDSSRFSIMIKPSPNMKNVVLSAFKDAFYNFGIPNSILSDNGAQFAGFRQGYTQFEKWLMNHDVLPIHGRIKHPQTQGKIERFHGSMKRELLNHYVFKNIEEANIALQEWRIKYNTIRPHEALGMKCPSEVYERSSREYTDEVKKYEYSGQYHVIKVNSWGYVRFDNFQVYLSETMRNEYIEFRPNPLGDSFIACFRNFKIAEFDADSGKRLNRKISRL